MSNAEIQSILGRNGIPLQYLGQVGPALILNLPKNNQVEHFFDKLGGTIKFGEIIFETTLKDLPTAITEVSTLKKIVPVSDKSQKVFFGISAYANQQNISLNKIGHLGLSVKKTLRSEGFSVRWVSSKANPLSSVIITKNELLTKGSEIVLLISNNKVLVGRTLKVQDFEKYSQRDYGRPKRDMKQGLLPPKLAQIMINLARVNTDAALLDPFCGGGTVLQEAWLMGYSNLIGTDINPKAINDTKKNLDWLERQYKLPELKLKLETHDARKPFKLISKNSIDAIITEPYLGPVDVPKNFAQIDKIKNEITILLRDAFYNFKSLLKKNGHVVIIIPRWQSNNQGIAASSLFDNRDFITVDLPDWIGKIPLVYKRPDQKVIREIYVLQKK